MLRVGIVSGNRLGREGLRAVLEAEGCGVAVCVAPADAGHALRAARVDVLVRYDSVPEEAGPLEPDPQLPTVQLAPLAWLRRHGTVLLGGGYRAAVDQECSPGTLARILRTVSEGYAGSPSGLAPMEVRPLPELSERELDVLRLVHRGLNNSAIAKALHISPGTVKGHVSSVLHKLGVDNRLRAALAYRASSHGG